MARINRDARYMSPHDAREAIAILSAQFEVDPPILSWNPRSNANGRYYSKPVPRITFGGATSRGVEPVMLHEFAHHLNHCLGGDDHDAGFWNALRRVAEAWYGDAAKYPWGSEYVTGKRYAASLGIRLKR